MEIVKMMNGGDSKRYASNDNLGAVQVKTADYTILDYDQNGKIFSNRGASGSVTFTLPTARGGRWFIFLRVASQDMVMTATGGAKIDGGSANGSITISSGNNGLILASDGTDWFSVTPDNITLASFPQGTNGQLIVGATGAAPAYQTVSGDAALAANGALTVAAGAITESKLAVPTAFGLGAMRTARAKYDFAVDGGAQGAITPATNCTIPDNAIILFGLANSTTAVTGGGGATISLGTTAGSSATSLKNAEAIASFGADSLVALVPGMSAASAVKMTAAGQIKVTVGTANLTAGVIEITLLYIVAAA